VTVRAVGQLLAVTAALVHGALAVADPSAVALAMLPLALGCVLCARHLGSAREWSACAVLDATMLGLMLLDHLATGASPITVPGHHGGAMVVGSVAHGGGRHLLMGVAEGLVVAQLALAVVVVHRKRFRRAP